MLPNIANSMNFAALVDFVQVRRFAWLSTMTAVAYFLVNWLDRYLSSHIDAMAAITLVAGVAAAAAAFFTALPAT